MSSVDRAGVRRCERAGVAGDRERALDDVAVELDPAGAARDAGGSQDAVGGARNRAVIIAEHDQECELALAFGAPRALGIALRTRGLLASGEEQLDLLQQAADVLAESGAKLELARALTDLGAARRRAGHAEARNLLYRGFDLAQRCGARTLAAQARAELNATGARPRRHALRGTDALTPSERRVAELAARGASNRDIAQALFVTIRTVELHLTHAYEKLDIRSRTDLARAFDGARPDPILTGTEGPRGSE